MAQIPYLLQSSFDAGATQFDTAITDVSVKGSYPHYSTLVKTHGITPYRGAYAFLIDLGIGIAANGCYQTHAAFNVAASNYWSVGTALYLKNIAMTTTNRHGLIRCMAGAAVEVSLDLYYTTAAGLNLCLDADGTGTTVLWPVEQNKWYWIELHGIVDSGVGNDGIANLVVNGLTVGSIATQDQGAFTDLLVGAVGPDAGTTGLMCFDSVYASGIDTTAVRLGWRKRWPYAVHVSCTASTTYGEHIFVGPGTVNRVELLVPAAGDIIRLYDTDTADAVGIYNLRAEVSTSGSYSVNDWIPFYRGCYVVVTAATAAGARGIVSIDSNPPHGYPRIVCYGNEGAYKTLAAQYKSVAVGV